jgi:hypothetical protein
LYVDLAPLENFYVHIREVDCRHTMASKMNEGNDGAKKARARAQLENTLV